MLHYFSGLQNVKRRASQCNASGPRMFPFIMNELEEELANPSFISAGDDKSTEDISPG